MEYPGAHYHLLNQENTGGCIFDEKGDMERFFGCLEKSVERFWPVAHTEDLSGMSCEALGKVFWGGHPARGSPCETTP
jgi:hypothetical protein